MSESEPIHLIAGQHFPWEEISGLCLRLESFFPLAKVNGDHVGPAMLGAFGLAVVELPNPDVEPEQRLISLPIEHKSDYKSLFPRTAVGRCRAIARARVPTPPR
jgi:hypothetical protein